MVVVPINKHTDFF